MSILVDLHMHSTFSDGRLTIPQIVDLYGSKGFGAIAITDHLCETRNVWGKMAHTLGLTLTPATFPLYQAILETEKVRAWEEYRMIVIPGIEITKNALTDRESAHILALGVTDYISADQKVSDILRQIREKDGVTVAAHPRYTPGAHKQTYYMWNHRQELAPLVDAWEIANGKVFYKEVEETDLPKLASSDFHHRVQFNSWKTRLACERHGGEILEAVREQALTFEYIEEGTVVNDHRSAVLESLVGVPRTTSLGNLALASAY